MQDMMALLAGASPRVALRTLDTLTNMMMLPHVEASAPVLLDKRLCSALLKNPAVMSPLVQFVFLHGDETPASDLELVALKGGPMINNLGSVEKLPVSFASCDSFSPGR